MEILVNPVLGKLAFEWHKRIKHLLNFPKALDRPINFLPRIEIVRWFVVYICWKADIMHREKE